MIATSLFPFSPFWKHWDKFEEKQKLKQQYDELRWKQETVSVGITKIAILQINIQKLQPSIKLGYIETKNIHLFILNTYKYANDDIRG